MNQNVEIDTLSKSYLHRCQLWLNERFPPINFISGIILYLVARSIVMLSGSSEKISFRFFDVVGVLIPMAHLFLLRVFDEHKDYESDKVFYPNRVIQQGIFKLSEVRQLGYLAFGLQFVSFLIIKTHSESVWVYAALWIWTLLMTKEFFCASWLKKNLLVYGFLHLLISPMILLSLLVLLSKPFPLQASWGWALIVSTLSGWMYELSRKSKGAEEETGDMSYTKLWGSKKSMIVLSISTLLTVTSGFLLLKALSLLSPTIEMGFLVIVILSLYFQFRFYKTASAKNRKLNELMVALISAYIFLIPILNVNY